MTQFRSWLAVSALTLALAAGLYAAENNATTKKKTCQCNDTVTKSTRGSTTCGVCTKCAGSSESCDAAAKATGCCTKCAQSGQSCTNKQCSGACCQNCPTCAAAGSQSVIHVYNVAKLLGDQSKCCPIQLMNIVTDMVQAQSWKCNGGPGGIQFFEGPGGACLIIRQTPMVHEQVAKLLASLEQVDKPGKPAVVLFRAGVPGPIPPAVNYQLVSGPLGLGYCENGVCALCGHGQMTVPAPVCATSQMAVTAPVCVPSQMTVSAPVCVSTMPCPTCPGAVVMQPCPAPVPAGVYLQSNGDFACQASSPVTLRSQSCAANNCSATCCPSTSAVTQTSSSAPGLPHCVSPQYSLLVSQTCTQHAGGECEHHLTIMTPMKNQIDCDRFSMLVAGQPVKVLQYPNVDAMYLSGKDWDASAKAASVSFDGKQITLSGQVRVNCRHGMVGEQVWGHDVILDMSTGQPKVQAVSGNSTMTNPSTEECETPESEPDPLAYLLWSSLFGGW